jgi:6-phosphogluconate dehydrogenase
MENKETLEEAAKRLFGKHFDGIHYDDIDNKDIINYGITLAKWQAERMYSEEDLKQFAFECVANFLSNNDNKVEIKLVDVIIDRVNNKFEQFKKK